MDEYAKEIADLEQQLERMVEADEPAKEVAEVEMQLELLKAIYASAAALYERGRGDRSLRQGLAIRGYGDWTLDSVYAFVYEAAVELPSTGHHAFLREIAATDFERLLLPVPLP
jgi:hypothetical protein